MCIIKIRSLDIGITVATDKKFQIQKIIGINYLKLLIEMSHNSYNTGNDLLFSVERFQFILFCIFLCFDLQIMWIHSSHFR